MNSLQRLARALDNGTSLEDALRQIKEFETPTLKLTDLPTSATGLTSGQVWNNAGVLTVVT